jgi:hypothetical protein
MTSALLAEALDKATISPYREALAFEYLYSREGMTLGELAKLTVGANRLPSEALGDYSGLRSDKVDYQSYGIEYNG